VKAAESITSRSGVDHFCGQLPVAIMLAREQDAHAAAAAAPADLRATEHILGVGQYRSRPRHPLVITVDILPLVGCEHPRSSGTESGCSARIRDRISSLTGSPSRMRATPIRAFTSATDGGGGASAGGT
jgi:hypothetical protein